MLEEARDVPLIKSLDDGLWIVDFASVYCQGMDSISDARDFVFRDFETFSAFLSDSEYHFESAAEKELKAFEEALEDSGEAPQVSEELAILYRKLDESTSRVMEMRREEILSLIQQEIVSRFYFHRGRVENGLNNDPQVIAAIEVLMDQDRYAAILKPE